MSAAVTPWFDAGVKPVRKGVYETDIPKCIYNAEQSFQCWDGRTWRGYSNTPNNAANSVNAEFESSHQNVQWRGLAANPAEAKP